MTYLVRFAVGLFLTVAWAALYGFWGHGWVPRGAFVFFLALTASLAVSGGLSWRAERRKASARGSAPLVAAMRERVERWSDWDRFRHALIGLWHPVSALLPLGLVGFTVLLFGAEALPGWLEALVYIGAFPAGIFAARRVARGAPAKGQRVRGLAELIRWKYAFIWIALPLLVTLVWVAVNLSKARESDPTAVWSSAGGWATALVLLALTLLTVSVALRLIGYSTAWWRILFAVGLGAAVLALLVAIGVIPLRDQLAATSGWWLASWLAVGMALVLGSIVVDAIYFARQRAPAQRPLWSARALYLGLLASVAAAAVMSIGIMLGTWSTGPGVVRATDARGHPIATDTAPLWLSLPEDDRVIAATLRPVLAFSGKERWRAEAVDPFLSGAWLIDSSGSVTRVRDLPVAAGTSSLAARLPATCPPGRTGRPCYRLSLSDASTGCPSGEEPCARGLSPHPRGAIDPGGAVYGRVVRASARDADPRCKPGDPTLQVASEVGSRRHPYVRIEATDRDGMPAGWTPDGSADPFEIRSPFPCLRALVQFWFFYDYDEWRRMTPIGLAVQRHEGDWEAITIGLAERQPLFVAYAAHCGGRWLPWHEIEATTIAVEPSISVDEAPDAGHRAVHPLVAVAEGSHASFSEHGRGKTADWAGCKHIRRETSEGLSYASNLRDITADDWRQVPPVLMARADEPPMNYSGAWGRTDETVIVNLDVVPLARGDGPLSPPLQPLWANPIATIFCDSRWRDDAGRVGRGCIDRARAPARPVNGTWLPERGGAAR